MTGPIQHDTSPEAHRIQQEVWRAMPGEKRLRLALSWSSWIRRIALDGVRQRHPEYSEWELKLAWLRKTMGDQAFFQAFPDAKVEW
jgi:hypothetical protein